MEDKSIETFCQELEAARKQFDTTLLGDAATMIRELCTIIDFQQGEINKLKGYAKWRSSR